MYKILKWSKDSFGNKIIKIENGNYIILTHKDTLQLRDELNKLLEGE